MLAPSRSARRRTTLASTPWRMSFTCSSTTRTHSGDSSAACSFVTRPPRPPSSQSLAKRCRRHSIRAPAKPYWSLSPPSRPLPTARPDRHPPEHPDPDAVSKDGQAKLKESTAKLWLNNKELTVLAKREISSLSAQPESLLEPLGNYEVVVKLMTATEKPHEKMAITTDFQKLPAATALPIDAGTEPGFLVRSARPRPKPQSSTTSSSHHRRHPERHGGNAVKNTAFPRETADSTY